MKNFSVKELQSQPITVSAFKLQLEVFTCSQFNMKAVFFSVFNFYYKILSVFESLKCLIRYYEFIYYLFIISITRVTGNSEIVKQI